MAPSFDPVAYINEPRWRHSSLGLERVSLLMGKLGHPERDFAVVHVAGTNGKGSVCAYLDSVLRAAGRRVGLFTSPYLERFEERIRVDGEDIPHDALVDATLCVRRAAEEVARDTGEHPTEFELMFAVACVHFSRSGCDTAVVEVGLGGRLDATNVVVPDLAVITRIGLDHTDILGDTLAQVAREKAGIVKPGARVVSYPQEPAALAAIEEACDAAGCALTVSDFSRLDAGSVDATAGTRRFSFRGVGYETGLLAAYQPANAAVAIDAASVMGVGEDAIRRGIAAAEWPGRFEVIGCDPLVIVDGSHNPQGAEALAASLEELLGSQGASCSRAGRAEAGASHAGGARFAGPRGVVTFVMGVLADKDYPRIVAPALPFARRFVVYAPSNPRALSADELAREVRAQSPTTDVVVAASAGEAVRLAVSAAQKEGPEGSAVVAFGTLYSIGEIKRSYASFGVSRP